jgi:ketosteroid isomerase-like protein
MLKRNPAAFAAMLFISTFFLTAVMAESRHSQEQDQQAIRKVLDDQTAAWNRGHIPTFMTGYWNSDKTEFVGAGGILRGYSNVLERYRKSYPDATAMGQLSFANLQIEMLSKNSAYVLGEFHLQRKKDNPAGVFTLILRKFPEGWRIVHDHTTAYLADSQHP